VIKEISTITLATKCQHDQQSISITHQHDATVFDATELKATVLNIVLNSAKQALSFVTCSPDRSIQLRSKSKGCMRYGKVVVGMPDKPSTVARAGARQKTSAQVQSIAD